MDALFPKRKSSVSSVKGSKALSAASYKIKDPVYSAQDDIGSGAGTLGAADSQPAALVSSGRKDLHEECDDVEEILRQFDMNMAYGPCLGISRLERFERACRLNLKPPMDVKNLLMRAGGNPNALWEGRV
ncbi:uncharacterized protein [Physcomitrium patens]|nr:DNA polymerase delta subunit 4-like [Physcomitrium patens]|eukprot:XP_024372617.1 DNA polymerase delta subunit 4-like [Physcomitrella patens]